MTLSPYRIMWVVVLFDLPVKTKKQRHRAKIFRDRLLEDGFNMKQFSVYLRHCPSREKADAIAHRIKGWVPPRGDVSVMFFTDKQFGNTLNFSGRAQVDLEEKPQQMVLL